MGRVHIRGAKGYHAAFPWPNRSIGVQKEVGYCLKAPVVGFEKTCKVDWGASLKPERTATAGAGA
jgi:hypothetical protein